MLVSLKSGQSASLEKAVEEMKDCQSTLQHCYLSTVMPEYRLRIFYDRLKPRSTYILVPGTTMERGFLGPSKKEPADSRTIYNTVHHGTVHRSTVHLDTIHPASIDTVHPPSIDTVHRDTVHPGTVHLNTVHPDIVHPVKK
ncbi:hypothetical protein DY000_02031206 [Brassica cretica]|uniref:Uncharacterized protein n=1 Tax=Brassica cretica TaxID=69181 RepID=A0ABQ7DFL8_BRACR|nr:hypothetical protein DY000_02031206 [Brassica cretica]